MAGKKFVVVFGLVHVAYSANASRQAAEAAPCVGTGRVAVEAKRYRKIMNQIKIKKIKKENKSKNKTSQKRNRKRKKLTYRRVNVHGARRALLSSWAACALYGLCSWATAQPSWVASLYGPCIGVIFRGFCFLVFYSCFSLLFISFFYLICI